VIDISTRQRVDTRMTPNELGAYARAHGGPDFEKRRGKMVLTDETREPTRELFKTFALEVAEDCPPESQLLTWCWLGADVATALLWHGTKDFDIHVRQFEDPVFTRYVEAIAEHRREDAQAAARELGVLNGIPQGHPLERSLRL
jgi:hypothetical protein